ncbi:MAG: hypothetical protein LBJ71_01685 [Holosporaceae bacterium]|jgi:hypothetical protein|nr:hypothetical protein [Holosporaceae bacterium]
MKNINRIKVVLPLIFGLSGIIQGSSLGNDDLNMGDLKENFHMSLSSEENTHEDSEEDSYADFSEDEESASEDSEEDLFPIAHPVRQESVPEEEQIYLLCDTGYDWFFFESDWFVFVNGRGDPIFFPETDLTTFLQNSKCIALPRRLFNKIANREICSSMMATYDNSEIGGAIRRRTNHEKARLSVGARRGYPFMALMKEGWTNGEPFAMIDGKDGKSYDSMPDEVDMRKAYRVTVSKTLYKKLTYCTFGEKVINVICTPARTLSSDFVVVFKSTIGRFM